MYDSLYPWIGTFVQKQIATLLRTRGKEIKVNIMNMQVQSGTCDCGLFAIATATSHLNGANPGAITYSLRLDVIYMTPSAGEIGTISCAEDEEIELKNQIQRIISCLLRLQTD